MVGAVLHRLHGGFNLVDRRDHDDFDEAVVFLDDAQDFEAADAGESDIEQHQIDVVLGEQGEGGLAARHSQDPVFALQDGGQRVPHPLVIIDDEDGFRLVTHLTEGGVGVLWQAVDTVASRSLTYEFC